MLMLAIVKLSLLCQERARTGTYWQSRLSTTRWFFCAQDFGTLGFDAWITRLGDSGLKSHCRRPIGLRKRYPKPMF